MSNFNTTTFVPVISTKSPYFSKVEKIFRGIVASRYGNQEAALSKIADGDDRRCELLIEKDTEQILALLVYKNRPNSHYKDYSIRNSLEVKTFLVNEPLEKLPSGDIYRQKLYRRATEIALNFGASAIHLTVSDNVPEMERFLRTVGFRTKREWRDKYIPRTKELLMCKYFDDDHAQAHAQSSSTGRMSYREHVDQTRRSGSTSNNHRKVKSITLMKKYIHLIRDGKKTIEGRVGTAMFTGIRAGDHIRFFYMHNQKDDVTCEVTRVTKYKTFRKMMEEEGVQRCIPDCRNLEEGCEIYNRIPGYSVKESKFGVIAFKLNVI